MTVSKVFSHLFNTHPLECKQGEIGGFVFLIMPSIIAACTCDLPINAPVQTACASTNKFETRIDKLTQNQQIQKLHNLNLLIFIFILAKYCTYL